MEYEPKDARLQVVDLSDTVKRWAKWKGTHLRTRHHVFTFEEDMCEKRLGVPYQSLCTSGENLMKNYGRYRGISPPNQTSRLKV